MAFLYGANLGLEELEREEQQREARMLRRAIRDAQDPFDVTEEEFIRNYRLSKDAARELVTAIEPYLPEGQRNIRIPAVFRVMASLNFMATGSYQRGVGNNFLNLMSQPMVSRSLKEVVNAILHILPRWVRFPRNNDERAAIKERFVHDYQMPHILGIVDGTHVAIVKPPNVVEHHYINRKGYHSLNCQVVCDGQCRILSIVSNYPGSSHDSYVWRRSTVSELMRANHENGDQESLIIGDSGYPSLPWLMVPIPRPANQRKEHFNHQFRRCRSVVERCIGILKGRFRCLLKDRVLHYSPETAANVVLACAVLHNMAIHFRIVDPTPEWDEIDLELHLPANELPEDAVLRNRGQQRRNAYVNAHF